MKTNGKAKSPPPKKALKALWKNRIVGHANISPKVTGA